MKRKEEIKRGGETVMEKRSKIFVMCVTAFCFAFVILIVGFSFSSAASNAAGSTTFQFLSVSPGARAVAMGGAYTAYAKDATAIFYNAAGLAYTEKSEAFLEFNNSFQGIDNYYLASVATLAPRHTLGVAVSGLQVGGLTRTQVTAAGEPVTGLGNFDANDVAVKISYAYRLTERFSLSGTGGVATSKIDNVSATGAVFDVGVLWRARKDDALGGFSAGVSVLNMGPKVKFTSEKEDLPLDVKVGLAYEKEFFGGRDRANLVFDFDLPKHQDVKVRLGGEYWVWDLIAGRVGYLGNNDAGSGVTAGVGFHYKDISFDWAYVPFGDLGNQHQFSLKLQFGGTRPGLTRSGDEMYSQRPSSTKKTTETLVRLKERRVPEIEKSQKETTLQAFYQRMLRNQAKNFYVSSR